MGREIKFPTRAVRSWEEIRREIERELKNAGLQDRGIEHISERLRQVWLKYDDYNLDISTSLTLPGNTSLEVQRTVSDQIENIVRQVEKHFQEAMTETFMDRVSLEIQLCLARNH